MAIFYDILGIHSSNFRGEPPPRTQIGNPDGADKPNKKYYDPRACIRSAEESTVERNSEPFFLLNIQLGGGFKYFLFSPLFGEDFPFD